MFHFDRFIVFFFNIYYASRIRLWMDCTNQFYDMTINKKHIEILYIIF